jgi:hypothetical protein
MRAQAVVLVISTGQYPLDTPCACVRTLRRYRPAMTPAAALANRRWRKTPKADRKAGAQKAAAARWAKYYAIHRQK